MSNPSEVCKVCSKCGVVKSAEDFYTLRYKNRPGWTGLRLECKACTIACRVADERANPEAARARKRRWRRNHPEAVRRQARERAQVRRKTDPNFKLKDLLRRGLTQQLKKAEIPKRSRALTLLNMDLKEFQIYIRGQFKPGMTWENHGTVWELDHVRPCASFNLSDPDQQKECFHWSNFQPLFTLENRKKGAKYQFSST